MRKLSRGQVARIIDAMERGTRSVYSIAKESGDAAVGPRAVAALRVRGRYPS